MTLIESLLSRLNFAPADVAPGGEAAPEKAADIPDVMPDEVGLKEAQIDLTDEEIQKAGIEIEPETEKTAPVDTAPTTGERKKNRTPARQRIGELTGMVREKDAALEQERAARVKAEETARANEETAMVYYEASTKANVEAAKRKLMSAKETGDTAAEVDAQAELAKASAELANIDAYKARTKPQGQERQPERPQETRPQPTQRPAIQPPPADLPPDQTAWLNANPWFVATYDGKTQNQEFDAELFDEARLFARTLERKYKKDGKADQIAGSAYFQEIDAHMRDQFPDYFGDDEAAPAARPGTGKIPAMQPGKQNVAAPNRSTMPGVGGNNASATRVSLSPEERALSRKLGMKHPNGKAYTDAEHERAFALQKMKLRAQDAGTE